MMNLSIANSAALLTDPALLHAVVPQDASRSIVVASSVKEAGEFAEILVDEHFTCIDRPTVLEIEAFHDAEVEKAIKFNLVAPIFADATYIESVISLSAWNDLDSKVTAKALLRVIKSIAVEAPQNVHGAKEYYNDLCGLADPSEIDELDAILQREHFNIDAYIAGVAE